jgi:Tfp pilus assembly protein PilN
MIEINLLPGKKKAAKGAGMQLRMPDFRAFFAQVKDPWLIAAVVAWIIVGGGGALLFITERARLARAESRLEGIRAEKRRYDIVIAQKRQLEKVRDSLLYQINVIRQIDADRYTWPHVLDQTTKALPPYTWITRVGSVGTVIQPGMGQAGGPPPSTVPTDDSLGGPPALRVQIDGRTVDIQAYTTFLRQLAASPWFTDVTPASSQTVIEADRPVTAFQVTVRYRVADSVYIRTVPFVQSMR